MGLPLARATYPSWPRSTARRVGCYCASLCITKVVSTGPSILEADSGRCRSAFRADADHSFRTMTIQDVMIPCQPIELNKAVGQQIGFYLGEPKDRTVAFTIEFSGRLNVYDAKTREYLRIATRRCEEMERCNRSPSKLAGELEENWPRNDYESDWREPRKCCRRQAF